MLTLVIRPKFRETDGTTEPCRLVVGSLRSKKMPNRLSPFDKHPVHIGYCLSCYKTGGPVYTIPLDVTTKEIKEILKREHPISGMPLEKEELKKVYPYVQESIEICWHDDLEFYLEGMNLPGDWEG